VRPRKAIAGERDERQLGHPTRGARSAQVLPMPPHVHALVVLVHIMSSCRSLPVSWTTVHGSQAALASTRSGKRSP
jgi:hypothetical protein